MKIDRNKRISTLTFCFALLFCQLPISNCTFAQKTEPSKQNNADYVLPEFQTKKPQFCFWNFPGGKKDAAKILVVADGDHLYVDRNMNQDLTEPDEQVVSPKDKNRSDKSHEFKVGEIRIGDLTHSYISLSVQPLENYGRSKQKIKQLLEKDPEANAYSFYAVVESKRFRDKEAGGRVSVNAGPTDLEGVLQFGDSIQLAPTINVLGDLEIRLYGETKLRPGSQTDITTVVGTPGSCEGSFAFIEYEELIPEDLKPGGTLLTTNQAGETEELEFELGYRC